MVIIERYKRLRFLRQRKYLFLGLVRSRERVFDGCKMQQRAWRNLVNMILGLDLAQGVQATEGQAVLLRRTCGLGAFARPVAEVESCARVQYNVAPGALRFGRGRVPRLDVGHLLDRTFARRSVRTLLPGLLEQSIWKSRNIDGAGSEGHDENDGLDVRVIAPCNHAGTA